MRRLIAVLVIAFSFLSLAPSVAASHEECRYVRINRPDGQPPIEIWVCP